MLKISIISVGKIKEKYIKLGIDEFSKRLSRYAKLEIIELNNKEHRRRRNSLKDKAKLIYYSPRYRRQKLVL